MIDTEENARRFDYETENFRQAARAFNEGCDIIRPIIDMIPERKREEAMRIYGVGKFIANTCTTAVNVREFYRCKRGLEGADTEKKRSLYARMLEICRREAKNAEDTIPLVEFDSRLGYEPSMEYMCDRAHIEWKLGLLRDVMEREIPALCNEL
jgi:hypothetical protein